MPPWVRVGPSSTARTRLPATAAGSSNEMGEAASTIMAPGFRARTERFTAATPDGSAVSTLLITTTWARRRFASPG